MKEVRSPVDRGRGGNRWSMQNVKEILKWLSFFIGKLSRRFQLEVNGKLHCGFSVLLFSNFRKISHRSLGFSDWTICVLQHIICVVIKIIRNLNKNGLINLCISMGIFRKEHIYIKCLNSILFSAVQWLLIFCSSSNEREIIILFPIFCLHIWIAIPRTYFLGHHEYLTFYHKAIMAERWQKY